MPTIQVAIDLQDFGPDVTLLKMYELLAAVGKVGIHTALARLSAPEQPVHTPKNETEVSPCEASKKTLKSVHSEVVKNLWVDVLVPYCECGGCHSALSTQHNTPWVGKFRKVSGGQKKGFAARMSGGNQNSPDLFAGSDGLAKPGIDHLKFTNASSPHKPVKELCGGIQRGIYHLLDEYGALTITGRVRPTTLSDRFVRSELSRARIDQTNAQTAKAIRTVQMATEKQEQVQTEKLNAVREQLAGVSVKLRACRPVERDSRGRVTSPPDPHREALTAELSVLKAKEENLVQLQDQRKIKSSGGNARWLALA